MTHTRGPLLEEDHYYPFGLTIAGISDKAIKQQYAENKFRFNGIEQNHDFDVDMYDAFYRNMDPQIGRFWQPDPVTNQNETVYSSMQNNPISKKDWLGNYFTWANESTENRYKMLRDKNNSLLAGYLKELSKLDLSSDSKAVKDQVSQLSTLIDKHADLNSQWNEMESSSVEFHVSDSKPSGGLDGKTVYKSNESRIDIEVGKDKNDIGIMAHELRHGYGYLTGELSGTRNGGRDPLYDMNDEIEAYNIEFLFAGRSIANNVAAGYYGIDWFKRTQSAGYPQLAGKEESLSLNTPAAAFLKYTDNLFLRSYINRNASNSNLTVRDVLNASNSFDINAHRPVEFVFGNWLAH